MVVDLGQKLRNLRKRKGLTLQAVADRAGLSKGFISQIETSSVVPSLSSLKKVAHVLDTPLGALVDDAQAQTLTNSSPAEEMELTPNSQLDVRVVRKDRRKGLVWPGNTAKTFLLTPDLQRKLEVTLDIEEPGHNSGQEWLSHEGEEFGFILEGRYEVTVGAQVFVLEEGDSIYFSSHLPHKTRVLGDRTAKTIWVITPPSF